MQRSLTQGPITRNMLLFALPLMCGNLLQQMYNIADTWVVGRFLGADALAAVGSSYTLMTFLTSIVLGLCMGSGAVISMQYGGGEEARMRQSVFQSFALIAGISLAVNLLVYLGLNGILWVLRVPVEIRPLMKRYLVMIFGGIFATFLYNYFANLLRAIGNSMVPLVFLAVSSILNVVLDLVCVLVLHWGVQGAAIATVFSQFVSGVGIGLYTLKQFPELCPRREDCKWDKHNLGTILNLSGSVCKLVSTTVKLTVTGNQFLCSCMKCLCTGCKLFGSICECLCSICKLLCSTCQCFVIAGKSSYTICICFQSIAESCHTRCKCLSTDTQLADTGCHTASGCFQTCSSCCQSFIICCQSFKTCVQCFYTGCCLREIFCSCFQCIQCRRNASCACIHFLCTCIKLIYCCIFI